MMQKETDLPANISAPARRALAGAGITNLEQLTHISEAELKKLHGLGPNGIKRLKSALEAKGLAFATERRSQR
jgi:hypothetical protein